MSTELTMGVLSNRNILDNIKFGHIEITPFDERQLNPNSYDLRLGASLRLYTRGLATVAEGYPNGHLPQWLCELLAKIPQGSPVTGELDSHRKEPTVDLDIPPEGLVLYPGILYLGHTVEHTKTTHFVPCITGRSSLARLGFSCHVQAGYGDNGFSGQWVLEITVIHPLRVYAHDRVAQIFYMPTDRGGQLYQGKYQEQAGAQASEMFRDFERLLPGV